MADGGKAGRGAGKRAVADPVAAAIAGFTLEAAEFPEVLKERALASGRFPYKKKMKREPYEERLEALQIELQKVQGWMRAAGERIVVVFEGRDAAGKGGAIARLTQHLNPRVARVVALPKPTDAERGQWYFQRYVHQMPTRGEMTVFDRSWYNRAGVEPVNGFCEPEQTTHFLKEAPAFERMLARDRIRLIKIFLDVGQEMQLLRLWKRRQDPLKQWKLSPIDFQAVHQWAAYSACFERMFEATHVPQAPWTVVLANDKLRARLAVIEHVLHALPYEGKDEALVGSPDARIVGGGGRFFDQEG